MDPKNNGNGHGSAEYVGNTGFMPSREPAQATSQQAAKRGEKGNNRTEPNFYHSLLQGSGGGHLSKELIQAKTVIEALAKANIKDANEATNFAMTFAQLKEFNMNDELEDLLLPWLLAKNSMGGRSRLEFLMGSTGILSPQMLNMKGKVYDQSRGYREPEDDRR